MYIITVFNIIMLLLVVLMSLTIIFTIYAIIENNKYNRQIKNEHACKNYGASEWEKGEIFSIAYEKIGLE